MATSSYWLAQKGGQPVSLPPVMPDTQASPDRIGGVHILLSGNRVTDTVAWKSSWELVFSGWISNAQYEELRDWTRSDIRGLGPFALYEDSTDAPVATVNIVSLTRRRQDDGRVVAAMTLLEV